MAAPHSSRPDVIGPGSEAGQLIAGVAPEQRGTHEASGHGHVATEPAPHRTDDQLLAGSDGHHPSGGDRLALQTQIGRPADDGHEGRAQAAQASGRAP